jgi:hypothetical protein
MNRNRGRLSKATDPVLWAFVCSVAVLAFGACAPTGPLAPRTIPLAIPRFSAPLVRDVSIPKRTEHRPVPLVIVLDDGPPVDNTVRRDQAERVGQLISLLDRQGYALWRPLKNAWPRDSILVRCPDELAAQVQIGLLSAKEIPVIDSAHIVILGFGQGGVIGTMVTKRTDRLVHALGIVGTPARSVDRVVASPTLRDSVTVGRLRKTFADIRAGSYPDTQVVLSGRVECWRSWMAVTNEIVEVLANIPQPVLAIQGTADKFLPLLDIERFRRAIRNRPNSSAHSAIGVRHDLRDAVPDPKQDQERISPRLVPIILNWLDRVAPTGR